MHEFPGGKCRPGELPADCAVRECAEETGLTVTPVRLLDERRQTYAHGTVELHFWICEVEDPTLVRDDQRGFQWIPAAELASLQFPSANSTVVSRLMQKFAHDG